MNTHVVPPRSIRFRARSFLATVLTPELPVSEWLCELDKWLTRTPDFFKGKPVVVDVANLSFDEPELQRLLSGLSDRGVRVMGIEGATSVWEKADLPPVLDRGRKASGLGLQATTARSTLFVDEPVRSGQAITFADGDVIILGSVSSGAEIIAGGSIHVCGTLRGRALAGARGNEEARIICRNLQAELVAINGYYKTADQIDPAFREKSIHVQLAEKILKIKSID